jgi:cell division protein FtsB
MLFFPPKLQPAPMDKFLAAITTSQNDSLKAENKALKEQIAKMQNQIKKLKNKK